MLKPKAAQPHNHWDNLSDEQLLDLELQVDDPRTLPGLVFDVPEGPEEPHVEFKYDLRGEDIEEFHCVHGHHRHKAGFVMRKGKDRFMVGHICGKSIYGEDFDRYTADYNAAVNRQDALIRVRDLRHAVGAFGKWVDETAASDAAIHFDEVGRKLAKMPTVIDVLTGRIELTNRDVRLPRYLLGSGHDLAGELHRLMMETAKVVTSLTGPTDVVAGRIGAVREGIAGLLRRANRIMDRLADVETFFQPAVVHVICESIDAAVPRRRRHFAGLMKITTRDVCLEMPAGFKTPSRAPIEAMQRLLSS